MRWRQRCGLSDDAAAHAGAGVGQCGAPAARLLGGGEVGEFGSVRSIMGLTQTRALWIVVSGACINTGTV